MPITAHDEAKEIPWRPGYRSFVLAGEDHGMTCIAGLAILEPGAGAPLHVHHDADEVLIVLEGTLDLRLGDERRLVHANHTIAVPVGTPHAFVAVGDRPVRMLTFLPKTRALANATTYFEGVPPKGAEQH
jgi:mannose-6-phosphate isomerase-like protein (cupin superfamily)